MNVLWLTFILYSVYTRTAGVFVAESEPCEPWSCLNTRMGPLDSDPPRHHFKYIFKGLLPQGPAQDVVEKIIKSCFDGRYVAFDKPGLVACPLQTHLLCILDKFIENCPEGYLNSTDVCTPVRTDIGTKYMFSQGVYRNIKTNPVDAQLVESTFSSKCCFVPEIINRYIMNDCGFTSLLEYQECTSLPAPVTLDSHVKTTEFTIQQ